MLHIEPDNSHQIFTQPFDKIAQSVALFLSVIIFLSAGNIIQELERLPLAEKLFVIKRALKSIRPWEEKTLKSAVDTLYNDYKNDKELITFTQLDNEPFYETK